MKPKLIISILFVLGIFLTAFLGIGYYDVSFLQRVSNAESTGLIGFIQHGFINDVAFWSFGFWISAVITLILCVALMRKSNQIK